MHIMSESRSLRDRTLDTLHFVAPPVGTLLTFSRGDKRQSFVWDRNTAAGHVLVGFYRFTGWRLVSAQAPRPPARVPGVPRLAARSGRV